MVQLGFRQIDFDAGKIKFNVFVLSRRLVAQFNVFRQNRVFLREDVLTVHKRSNSFFQLIDR